jgi:hypothetical protein
MKPFAWLLLVTAAAFSQASEAGATGEPCLRLGEIVGALNTTLRDSHTAIVSTRNGEKFLVGISGWCQDLDMSAAAVSGMCIKPGDWIASKGDPVKYALGNITKSTGSRCLITKVDAYTAAMQQADKSPNH